MLLGRKRDHNRKTWGGGAIVKRISPVSAKMKFPETADRIQARGLDSEDISENIPLRMDMGFTNPVLWDLTL